MAVIGKIRKHSGLLIVVIGIALAAFVLGDLSKASGGRTNTVGEVNGEEISYKAFSSRVEQNLEYQKQQQRKQSLTPSESFFVREQTWNQFVNEILLEEEYSKLGLSISIDELAELLHGNNPHYLVKQNFSDPLTGEFNADMVLNFLRTLNQLDQAQRQQYYNFEQAVKKDQINSKFSNLITKGYYFPLSLAEHLMKNSTVTANVQFLAKDASSIADSLITITDKDLKKYYNDHIEEYQLEEEVRAIDYVVFEVVPSVNDRLETTELVKKLYHEFMEAENAISFVNSVSDHRYDSSFFKEADLPIQIASRVELAPIGTIFEPYLDNEVFYITKLVDKQFRPDSMLASHVLITYKGAQGSTLERSKVEAKQFADSLFKVIDRTPSKLAEMARKYSDDPSAKENSGDLGWFADMTMMPAFNNAAINAIVGDIQLVETIFGYHILEVNGKKNISRKYRLAIIDRAVEASSDTYQDYWTMASKFAAENTDLNSFTKTVSELGLYKRTYTGMTRMTNNIYDLQYPRQVVRWSFEGETEVGSISPILDFEGKYIISIVTDIEESGSRDFEKVKDLIEAKVRVEKKNEYILNELKNTTDFDQIAKKWNVTSETSDVNFNLAVLGSRGREPKVIGEIFGMQAGEIKTIIGDRGVYVVKLSEMKTPETKADAERYRTQLTSSFTNRIYQNAVIRALTNAADIDENRHLFY